MAGDENNAHAQVEREIEFKERELKRMCIYAVCSAAAFEQRTRGIALLVGCEFNGRSRNLRRKL
jgi:hypothetical protein